MLRYTVNTEVNTDFELNTDFWLNTELNTDLVS